MSRPPETPGKPATERIDFRVNADLRAYIDKARGTETRSRWLRDLVRDHARKAAR